MRKKQAGFVLKIKKEARNTLIDEIYQWAKDHNQCSDLVATSDLMRYLEILERA